MQNSKARELFSKYQSGQCSEEERNIVENWLFFGEATNVNLTDEELVSGRKDVAERLGIVLEEKKWFSYKFTAAAAVLITLGLGLLFYNSTRKNETILPHNLAVVKDIKPGGNNAILTLSDGKIFNLKDAGDRTLFHRESLSIINSKSGKLIYSEHKNPNNISINRIAEIHSVTTPRGGQYQMTLPDGTQVWLNCASSLKFPAQFSGNERYVELNGEAYFEVAKDKNHPFIVKTKQQDVKVLGTHFNVMAYSNEPVIETTLLEGSVKVIFHSLSYPGESRILIPGQQSQITAKGISVIDNINVDDIIAWKNGYFSFKRTSLPEIMQQISRWYNVDVVYDGKVSYEEDLSGKIKRSSNLSKTLELLEFSGVHFKVKGRQVIVTPKQ